MSDLISRKAVMNHIENEYREWGDEYDALQILGDIEDMPSAEPKKGKWVDDKLPEKAEIYLVTVYGDSIGENYVMQAEYLCRPRHNKQGFFVDGKDITEYVIAWMPVPKAYGKSHKPIMSENYDDWIDHHL